MLPRIGRWILNALTLASLLLCAATCVLWARSYWRDDSLVRAEWRDDAATYHERSIFSDGGRLGWRAHDTLPPTAEYAEFLRDLRVGDRVDDPRWAWRTGPSEGGGGWAAWSTTSFVIGRGPKRAAIRVVTVAHWLPAGLFALLPAARTWPWLRRRRRLRRLAASCCPQCGYDCRATPGRCPECGRALAEEKEPQLNADARRSN
ncbi:MAG TPA: hypothetical protein VEA69_18220 [Tepidisphaeraceae bacterium]|nr:hypothetical protein [Tepidisphaeraceae bacterium]